MEEQEITCKSYSEWASPLVLVWKKTGDLRVCVDYCWLNTGTVKDAHPLPHQADCLAALGEGDRDTGMISVEFIGTTRKAWSVQSAGECELILFLDMEEAGGELWLGSW
ncbi:hypothetical protein QTP70_009185 [Hemibagrus guttatus]|uniref:Uncharacterized protein n=1 Tax=Hemibagrus guttatus TaxID=175788 RepID=A0AAE0VCV7_9TELE|nr:hypothetical protein QTP70_009185 [Hemibagrus guttatus]